MQVITTLLSSHIPLLKCNKHLYASHNHPCIVPYTPSEVSYKPLQVSHKHPFIVANTPSDVS